MCAIDPSLAVWADRCKVVEQVVIETKYAGFVERQSEQIARFQKMESRLIPGHFDYCAVPQLRMEAKEKLSTIRPANFGQASRISGITPADLAVLLFYLG
jgi:tRNA uridine 5-carboxymethylaminomethyl modification enzyme